MTKKSLKKLILSLSVLCLAFFSLFAVTLNNKPTNAEAFTKPSTSKFTIRVASYNVCVSSWLSGYNYSTFSMNTKLDSLASNIKSAGIDIMGCQEIESGTAASQGMDVVASLAQKSGLTYYRYFSCSTADGGTYGNAILSKYPIIDSTEVSLTNPPGYQARKLGIAVIEVNGIQFHFGATHLSFNSEADGTGKTYRTTQFQELNAKLNTYPSFICSGDFNTGTFSEFTAIANSETVNNSTNKVPTYQGNRYLDNIVYSKTRWVADVPKKVVSSASDHDMLYTDFSYQENYKVTVTNNNDFGTVSGISTGNYEYNKTFNVSVTPKAGYRIKSVSWGGKDQTVSNGKSFSKSFTLSNKDVAFKVVYAYDLDQTAYDVSLSYATAQCSIKGIATGTYPAGTKFNVTISAYNGYSISSVTWGATAITVPEGSKYSFNTTLTMPSSNAKLSVTCADETASKIVNNTMVSWYKFSTNEEMHVDSMGNYNLGRNWNSTITHTTDGIQFANNKNDYALYAPSSVYNPVTYFGAGQSFTISTLYFTGTTCGGGNNIFSTSSSYGGVTLARDNGVLRCFFWNIGNYWLDFPVEDSKWVRVFITYDGNVVYMQVYNVTDKAWLNGTPYVNDSPQPENTGTKPGLVFGATYSLSHNSNGFCIGNKCDYNQTGGDAGFSASDHKLADLRIYNGVIDTAERDRILWGDASRRTTAELKFSYRPFVSGDVTTDQCGKNNLVPASSGSYTPRFDATYHTAIFNVANSGIVTSATHNCTNSNGGAKVDWSDYIRNGSFAVSFRMYLQPGVWNGTNKAYYIMSTGSYGYAFNISADQNNVRVYLGNGTNQGDKYFLNFYNAVETTGDGVWIRGLIQYTNDTYTGSITREVDDKTLNGVLYHEGATGTLTKQTGFTVQGGTFGGYDYSFTLGGQSRFGESIDGTAYATVNGSARNGCRIARLDVYTGVLSDSEINAINALDDKMEVVRHSSTSSNLIANYEFKDTNNLGYDSKGNFHLINKGGATYDSTNGGLKLAAGNRHEDATSYLYLDNVAKSGYGIDGLDKYHGSMTVYFRARLQKMGNYPYVIVGNGTDYGFYIAVKNDGFEVKSYPTIVTFDGLLTTSPLWYKVYVHFDFTENTVSLQMIKEQDNSIINAGTKSRKVDPNVSGNGSSHVGFGGSFANTFTIGGIASNGGTKLMHGASEGDYYITLSNLKLYTGIAPVEQPAEEKISLTINNDNDKGTVSGTSAGNNFSIGSNISITVTAKVGYNIKSIKVDGVAQSITNNQTMTVSKTINNDTIIDIEYQQIEIPPNTYTATVTNDGNKGTVTGIVNGQSYEEGATLNISVEPLAGYDIESVTLNGITQTVGNVNNFTVSHTVNGAITLQVIYAEEIVIPTTYLATVNYNSDHGSIDGIVNGQSYNEDTSLNIQILANIGYDISSVTINGLEQEVTNADSVTISYVVTQDCIIEVMFEAESVAPSLYTVTVNNSLSKGTVSGVTNGGQYVSGTNLMIIITATEGYEIKSIKWGIEEKEVTNKGFMTISVTVEGDVTLSITYEPIVEEQETSPSCFGSVEGGYFGAILLIILASLMLVKKAKKN